MMQAGADPWILDNVRHRKSRKEAGEKEKVIELPHHMSSTVRVVLTDLFVSLN